MLMNNKFKAQTLNRKSYRKFTSCFSVTCFNISCYFDQSARSIESRCVVKVMASAPNRWQAITCTINSLAPGKFEWNFRYLIFQIISVIDGWVISCELALRWMSLDLTDDKSTLVQVMAWCHQATSHYLNQCWPRSLSPYGITRPQ